MLTLNLKAEPYWMDLPRGVRVQVMPARASLMEAVRSEVLDARLAGGVEDDAAEDDASDAPQSIPFLLWAKVMARQAIVAWEGVGDEAGKAIAPSPDYIDALIEDDRVYVAWRDQYVIPALRVAEEGND